MPSSFTAWILVIFYYHLAILLKIICRALPHPVRVTIVLPMGSHGQKQPPRLNFLKRVAQVLAQKPVQKANTNVVHVKLDKGRRLFHWTSNDRMQLPAIICVLRFFRRPRVGDNFVVTKPTLRVM